MKPLSVLPPLLAVVLASPATALAQGGVMVGGAVGGAAGWPRAPYYYPAVPFPYGGYAPFGPCAAPGLCADSIQLRRTIEREMRLQELRREPEAPLGGGFARPGESPYAMPRYLPPATPESEVQPNYRGSGNVRPEYENAGQPVPKR